MATTVFNVKTELTHADKEQNQRVVDSLFNTKLCIGSRVQHLPDQRSPLSDGLRDSGFAKYLVARRLAMYSRTNRYHHKLGDAESLKCLILAYLQENKIVLKGSGLNSDELYKFIKAICWFKYYENILIHFSDYDFQDEGVYSYTAEDSTIAAVLGDNIKGVESFTPEDIARYYITVRRNAQQTILEQFTQSAENLSRYIGASALGNGNCFYNACILNILNDALSGKLQNSSDAANKIKQVLFKSLKGKQAHSMAHKFDYDDDDDLAVIVKKLLVAYTPAASGLTHTSLIATLIDKANLIGLQKDLAPELRKAMLEKLKWGLADASIGGRFKSLLEADQAAYNSPMTLDAYYALHSRNGVDASSPQALAVAYALGCNVALRDAATAGPNLSYQNIGAEYSICVWHNRAGAHFDALLDNNGEDIASPIRTKLGAAVDERLTAETPRRVQSIATSTSSGAASSSQTDRESQRQAQAEQARQQREQAEQARQQREQAEQARQAQAERERQAQEERERQAQEERERQAQAERERQAQEEQAEQESQEQAAQPQLQVPVLLDFAMLSTADITNRLQRVIPQASGIDDAAEDEVLTYCVQEVTSNTRIIEVFARPATSPQASTASHAVAPPAAISPATSISAQTSSTTRSDTTTAAARARTKVTLEGRKFIPDPPTLGGFADALRVAEKIGLPAGAKLKLNNYHNIADTVLPDLICRLLGSGTAHYQIVNLNEILASKPELEQTLNNGLGSSVREVNNTVTAATASASLFGGASSSQAGTLTEAIAEHHQTQQLGEPALLPTTNQPPPILTS